MEKIIVLGATGNIGKQCLDLLKNNQDYVLKGISLYSNVDVLQQYLPYFNQLEYIGIANLDAYIKFKSKYPNNYKVICSPSCSLQLINECKDCVVFNSLTSSSGFEATKLTMLNNQDIMLANKESVCLFTEEFMQLKKNYTGNLFPVDSEHVALEKMIKQLRLIGIKKEYINSYIITASGGALRDVDLEKMNDVKLEDVLNHPTWSMSDYITIDCATMVNKAYEILEAYALFDIPLEKIKARICRTSKIHAAITYSDNGVEKYIYEYGENSMSEAISYALSYGTIKHHIPTESEIKEIKNTQFLQIDKNRYPLYYLLLELYNKGGDSKMLLFESFNLAQKKKLFNQSLSYKEYSDSLIDYVNKQLNDSNNTK